jgi:hypothetical protein
MPGRGVHGPKDSLLRRLVGQLFSNKVTSPTVSGQLHPLAVGVLGSNLSHSADRPDCTDRD